MTVLYNDNGRLNPLKSSGPIASVTFNGRTVVNVSAIDTTAMTFTSVGSNLTNGWVIHITLNDNAGNVYLPNVIAGGVTAGNKYYVVNATADTFQLATSSGGAAITLSANANLDLTKWHFETAPTESTTLQITGLQPKKKYRAVLKGKTMRIDNVYMQPSNWGNIGDSSWLRVNTSSPNNSTTFGPSYTVGNAANIMMYLDNIFNSETGSAVIYERGGQAKTSTTTVNSSTMFSDVLINQLYGYTNITDITVTVGGGLANGTVLEVYDI